MRVLFLVGILLAPGVAAATMVTAGPTFGWDDINFVELHPFDDQGPMFLLTSSWLDAALGHGLDHNGNLIDEPNFVSRTKWTFTFANDSTVIFKDNFKSIVYVPWVVHDPGLLIPGGRFTNSDTGDVGGVDFSFVYTPASGDVGFGTLGNVHFLQIIRTSSIFRSDQGGPIRTETRYFTDNLGSDTTPFADAVGANSQLPGGGIVTKANGTMGKFFFDDPDRCEPFPYGYGDNPDCMTDKDPSLVFIDWQAQTFVSVDKVTGGRHDVTLYGGPWWGFTYVNSDVPEPSTNIPIVLALFVMAGSVARKRMSLTKPSSSACNQLE